MSKTQDRPGNSPDGGVRTLLLKPEFCPGGQRLTCGPTLSINQMHPWD